MQGGDAGGVWDELHADDAAQPATRGTWLTVVAAAFVVAVWLGGRAPLRRLMGRGETLRWFSLGLGGLGLAALLALPLGQDALRWAVAELPGAGLLRDGQKWLAPTATLSASGVEVIDAEATDPAQIKAWQDELNAALGR